MYPRIIEKEIGKYLDCKQAIFILGARQVGKTSLLNRLIQKLPKHHTFYFDLSRISDRRLIESGTDEFLQFLKFQGLDLSHRNYIFIDEIQYFDEFSGFVKILVDHHSDAVKLILSGSSAAQIKTRFKDSLAGRKYMFHLYPLTFKEFLVFKEMSTWAEKIDKPCYACTSDNLRFCRKEILFLLNEFMVFGGYPEIAKITQPDKKVKYLKEILDAYIIKDIRAIFSIGNTKGFNHLVRYTAINVANLFSVNSAANEIGLARETISHYINILEDTFILKRLRPFYLNKTTELKKAAKIFFMDNGLRNALLDNFNALELRNDQGLLIENHVFSQLHKNKAETDGIYFWRTTSRQEIDFIIKQGDILYPLEVKVSGGRAAHMKKFMNQYQCKHGFVASLKQPFDVAGDVTVLPVYLI